GLTKRTLSCKVPTSLTLFPGGGVTLVPTKYRRLILAACAASGLALGVGEPWLGRLAARLGVRPGLAAAVGVELLLPLAPPGRPPTSAVTCVCPWWPRPSAGFVIPARTRLLFGMFPDLARKGSVHVEVGARAGRHPPRRGDAPARPARGQDQRRRRRPVRAAG